MPALPPPVLAPRRVSRKIRVGKVEVGGDAPVSVQSMCTTPDHRRQRDAAADRRAHGHRLRHRPGRLPQPGRRRRPAGDRPPQPDPGHRRHPLPAEVRLRRDRRRLRRGPRQPRQHPQVRRPGQGDRPGGQGRRRLHPDRGQRRLARPADHAEVRQGHPGGARRVGRLGGEPVRGARLPRLQDLGEAQRPRGDGARLRAARRGAATGRCTSVSPRPAPRSRGRSSPRSRSARCCPRASATPSASRSARRRSRRSRSASRSCSR